MIRCRLDIPTDLIAELCRGHHIRRLALFGSVLRDDFTTDSDVDVLVEFEEGHTPGLGFFATQDDSGRRTSLRLLPSPGRCIRFHGSRVR